MAAVCGVVIRAVGWLDTWSLSVTELVDRCVYERE